MEIANTRVTIMRGTEVNAYGDETDVGLPILTGIPAAINESSDRVWDRATDRPQTVRTWQCVLPGWVEVRTSDTLLDERTRTYFMINRIQTQNTGATGIRPAVICTLRSRSGVTVASDRREGT